MSDRQTRSHGKLFRKVAVDAGAIASTRRSLADFGEATVVQPGVL